MLIVKGFSIVLEKLIWVVMYIMYSLVMELYFIDMVSGIMMMMKVSVFLFILNMELKRLKRMMIKDIIILFIFSILISWCFLSFFVKFRNEKMLVLIVWLLFII